MPRGAKREVGSVRIAQNGYRYIQTEQGQRLLHHVLAETYLGRPLRPDERVYFVDGDRTHVNVENIEVKSSPTRLSQLRRLLTRVEKMQEEIGDVRNAIEEALESERDERDYSSDSAKSKRV